MAKRKAGAKSKLTAGVLRGILRDVALGATWKDAAIRSGIGERTIHTWRERGYAALGELPDEPDDIDIGDVDDDTELTPEERRQAVWAAIEPNVPAKERPYARLVWELEIAQVTAKLRATAAVFAAFDTDYRAALAYLERRHREEWGRETSVHLSGGYETTGRLDPADVGTLAALQAALEEANIGTDDEEQ